MRNLNNEVFELRERVETLEFQLEKYLSWMEDSVEQRDRFVLSSSWGIVKAISAVIGFVAFNYVLKNWFELSGGIWSFVGVFGGLAAYMAAFAWQERGEENDVKKFYRLPKWEERDKL